MKEKWYTIDKKNIFKILNTKVEGLTTKEVNIRLKQYGKNVLPKAKQKTFIQVFFEQFKNPIVYILLITMILSFIIGEYIDGAFILFVILIDAVLGSVQEYRSNKNAEALAKLIRIDALVIRNNKEISIPSEDLVPGDIVLLESGSKVPADLRLIETQNLTIDESLLTGESIPREKSAHLLSEECSLSERTNMAYLGTSVMRGRAKGIVVSTSSFTEIGNIAKEVLETDDTITPLQIRMQKFTKQLGMLTAILALIVTTILYFKGYAAKEIFFLVVALSISSIPEGLPVVITLSLSISSNKMAKRNVLVKKLNAVEALGSATIIASDKTGTLTLNEQTVKKIVLPNNDTYEVTGVGYNDKGEIKPFKNSKLENIDKLVKEGLYNNEASLSYIDNSWVNFGDSMDTALLSLGYKYNLEAESFKNDVLGRIPYESDAGYSCAFYKEGENINVSVKGTLEKILSFCTSKTDKEKIRKQNEDLAKEGYRVLAFATGTIKKFKIKDNYKENDIPKLTFLGLVAFVDPIRPDAKEAIKSCKQAGIKTVMITGDHPLTAFSVAKELELCTNETEITTGLELKEVYESGLDNFDKYIKTKTVFSRVSPIQKLQIVESYKRLGEFIAVTGDGVNDSPALKAANVGIAMGSGTDVAKETGALIITDDKFSSILNGVEEGRCAYDNVRKVTYMLLSCGVSEVVFYILSIALNYDIPLTAVQLLWLNLVTDGIQDVALSFESSEKDILKRKPRDPKESLFDRLLKNEIMLIGLIMGITVFGVWIYLIDVLGYEVSVARSHILLLMVFLQNLHCFNCRSEIHSIFSKPIKENKQLIISIAVVLFIQFIVVENSFLSHLLDSNPIPLVSVLYLFLLSLPIIIVSEILKYFERDKIRRNKN